MFPELEVHGAKIRRGQLTLIGAAPNGGKSSLATFIAMEMRCPYDNVPIPSMYFSADSDVTTFGMRAGAIALKTKTVREVEELILAKDEDTLRTIEEYTDHIWVSFESAPSPKAISDEMDMYAMVNGEYPHYVVVDNLMDVPTGGRSEWGDQDAILDFLKQLARRTSAAIVVLCHVVGAYTDGDEPIPRSGLMNKIDKRPRLILTLHNIENNLLGISIVKNNNGVAAANGSLTIPINWVKEKMLFFKGGR